MNQKIFIIYGVSGCGKTSVGQLLAEELQVPFYDADDYHPKTNIEKMSQGIPLNDEDRTPWLSALNSLLKQAKTKGAVLACSALKEKYRGILKAEIEKINWVLLDGDFDLIKKRIQNRQGHFMSDALLQSQFDTLEKATYGLKLDINQSKKALVEKIKIMSSENFSDIGVIGLGVMGKNIAMNLLDKSWNVSVYNRSTEKEKHLLPDFLKKAKSKTVRGFDDFKSFASAIKSPRKILMMVPSGEIVDQVINDMIPHLNEGDLLMDGGNSHYTDTKRRIATLKEKGIDFLGLGISGGEKGARFGPAIMPGGKKRVYDKVSNILESIAAKNKQGNPCCSFIGESGSGHFVKMIHNGIEYAEMALIAELYALLRTKMTNEEIATYFLKLNNESSESYLLEISVNILRKQENEKYVIDNILDKAGNKGTGKWSINAALNLGQSASMMAAALEARYISSLIDQRKNFSKKSSPKKASQFNWDLNKLAKVYEAARMINHHQGFNLIKTASENFNWKINLSQLADIWTNGCIIRSSLMEKCVDLLDKNHLLLFNEAFFQYVDENYENWKELIKQSLQLNESLPVFSAGLQYWMSITNEDSNTNMIQAQRDYFGSHTYQLKDKPEITVHTQW